MTTIATDGKTIAADSYATGDYCIHHVQKLFDVPGGILGVAGFIATAVEFVEWLKAENHEIDPPKMEGTSAIMLTHKGEVWFYDETHVPFKNMGPCAAIGSGAQAALAAMHLGYSPRDAVKVAALVDPCTGGTITSLSIAVD
jgi:20S proteasome alpha/beta subunit